jgi:hypothetical protein
MAHTFTHDTSYTIVAYSRVSCSCACAHSVFAGGDAMAQKFIEDSPTWDYRRSLSIGLLGALQNGLFMHAWYRILDKVVSPKTNPTTVLKKIACDEAVFAPQVRYRLMYARCAGCRRRAHGRWRQVTACVWQLAFATAHRTTPTLTKPPPSPCSRTCPLLAAAHH